MAETHPKIENLSDHCKCTVDSRSKVCSRDLLKVVLERKVSISLYKKKEKHPIKVHNYIVKMRALLKAEPL